MPARSRSRPDGEVHRSLRTGWLRAAILGADDAIVSTSSLMIGIAASDGPRHAVLLAGVAGLVAGAMSMAAGEYVSVSSQRDTELADIEIEKRELASQPRAELSELAAIYHRRGLDKELAMKVARQLSAHDRLAAHVRDELGFDDATRARPMQAALASGASFATFALVPIVALLVAPTNLRVAFIVVLSLVSLCALGAVGARVGGASMVRGALRVAVGGSLAMAVTALVGRLFGVATG
jgi:vacuolar iron transporter family protein